MIKSNKLFREPKVENKYNLVPSDIKKLIVINKEALKKNPFWRNNIVNAYCLSESTAKNSKELEYCADNEYWIGFYDDDAKAYAGKTEFHCSAYGGMCHYNFKKFYDQKEIECEIDLEIQEKLLKRVNWLLDEGICTLNKHLQDSNGGDLN